MKQEQQEQETVKETTRAVQLTDKQLNSIQQIQVEKLKLQEDFKRLDIRESTILELVLDFNNINSPKSVKLEGRTLVIEL